MKKSGILNAKLMEELTALGHFDRFVICDIGFPIPRGAVKIDLALVEGVPGFLQTLKAVLKEVVVQQIFLMDAVKDANPKLYSEACTLLTKQETEYCDFAAFRKECMEAKFFIRTGEAAPCSNMILVSASGVAERVQKYNIDPE